MAVSILEGDARAVLKTLPDESVHCVVTSPPYFGLRDYGMAGQMGLEASPGEFIEALTALFAEVRRVLRADGTAWVNMGDTYSTQGGPGWQGKNGQRADRRFTGTRNTVPMREQARTAFKGTKPKDLLGMPWRLAFALQDDGWWLRQDIIWSKPNPMPESVTDRCTKAHEYLFLLAKSEHYYYDFDAVAEPRVGDDDAGVSGWAAGDVPHTAVAHNRQKGDAKTFRGGQYVNGNKFDNSHATKRSSTGNKAAQKTVRNRRSVWTVAPEPFADAHFATYPPALIEPCILAGCPKGGTVLDPFGGAGTTGLVADRLGRDAILIELNPEYAAMARKRINGDAPLFAPVLAPQPHGAA